MTRPVIGLLVIGQSPRPDLEGEFARIIGDRAEIRLLGALDHLDDAAIAEAAPTGDADTLYTTLPSGRSVLISKAAVIKGMAGRLDDLKAVDAAVWVVCCTGKFPTLTAPGVHFASDLLAGAVDGCLPGNGRLGVFIPMAAQAAECSRRWSRPGRECITVPLSPGADDETIRIAARDMAAHAPDLVVHDCISYTSRTRDIAHSIHGRQTLLAVSVCARFATELGGF